MRTNRRLVVSLLAIALLALTLPVAQAVPVSYLIEVVRPSDGTTVNVTGWLSANPDGQVTGDVNFLPLTSGGGVPLRVGGPTTTVDWDALATRSLKLRVESTGTSNWQTAPWIAVSLTAPPGKTWVETGTQYLYSYQNQYDPGPPVVPGVPPPTPPYPAWRGASASWGTPGYTPSDLEVWDVPTPTPPVGAGFAQGTQPIWGYVGITAFNPVFLDVAGTLQDGTWAVAGTPLPSLPGGTPAGVTAMVIRSNAAIGSLDQAGSAMWLRPGDTEYSMGVKQTLPVTQIDGANAGYDMILRDGAGNPIGQVPVLAGTQQGQTGQAENYAARMEGYIYIPSPGDYSFAVGSNDGSRFKIGNTVVYSNTGTVTGTVQSTQFAVPVSIPQAGYWPYSVDYFQNGAEGDNVGVVVSAKPGNFATWDSSFTRLGDTGGLQTWTRDEGFTPIGSTYYQGLIGRYFQTANMTTPLGMRLDLQPNPNILGGLTTNINSRFEFPSLADPASFANGPWGQLFNDFTVQWTGYINIPTTQNYSFIMDTDDVSWIWIDTNNDGTLEAAPGNGAWTVTWTNVALTAGLHKVMFQAREYGGGDWSNLRWSPGGGANWQFIPETQFSTPLGGPLGPLNAGPPIFADPDGTLMGETGDGLRVQQAPIAGVTNVSAVQNFFKDKVIHNDPTKNKFVFTGSSQDVRRYMDMVDPDNPAPGANGNFGVNQAFPNNVGGTDDNNFGTRINALFYAPSAGDYSFTVSSDDSFWLRVGTQILGSFATNRDMPTGTANQMYVNLPVAGLYPLEFYSHSATGAAGIEVAHRGETSLLVTSRDPSGQGASVDWGLWHEGQEDQRPVGFSVIPRAQLKAQSVALLAQAFGEVPALALAGVPLSEGKVGVVNPERWKLEQLLGQSVTLRTPDPANPGQYITGLRGRWYETTNTGWPPPEPPVWDSDTTGTYYNEVARANSVYPGPGPTIGTPDGDNFSVKYTGQIHIPTTGTYIFGESVDDRSWIFIDGTQILSNGSWNNNTMATVNLTAGWHNIEMGTNEGGGGDFAYFFWDKGTGTLPLPAYWVGSGAPSAAEIAAMDGYLLKADWLQEELLLLAEGTDSIGDLLNMETLMTYPMDWHQEYTLRLTTEIAGLTAIYQDTFKFLPEPTTLVVLAGGLLAVARRRRNRRK